MNTNKIIRRAVTLFALGIIAYSCSNDLHITLPEGPSGATGKSAYELWVDAVDDGTIDWPKDQTDIVNFFLYFKGVDGKDGADGENGADGKDGVDGVDGANGLSAYEMWVEEVAKGIENPHNKGNEWPKDNTELNHFWDYLTGTDGADGKSGSTPVIGDNGNWWVDGVDTEVPARGDEITISADGYWVINGIETNQPAFGEKGDTGAAGEDGKSGLSAYELWKEAVNSIEGLTNPHDDYGENWPTDKTTQVDFWEYLRGKNGKDGQFQPMPGVINVIAQYSCSDGTNYEYVNWKDGSVLYKVTDENGDPAPDNTRVIIVINRFDESFSVSGGKGEFTISKDKLPASQTGGIANFITTEVTIPGKNSAISAPVTYVPCKMEVRIVITDGKVPLLGRINYKYPSIDINFEVQRRINPTASWERIPAFVGDTRRDVYLYEVNATNGDIHQQPINEPLIGRGGEANRIKYDVSLECMLQVERKITDSYLDLAAAYEDLVGSQDDLEQKCPFYWGEWDDSSPLYFTLGITDCYGETPKIDAAIMDVPVQLMPIPIEMKVSVEERLAPINYLMGMKGKFASSYIVPDLCFENQYAVSRNDVLNREKTYRASKFTYSSIKEEKIFAISFKSYLDQQLSYVDNTQNASSIKTPEFNLTGIVENSSISVFPQEGTLSTWNFYPIEDWSSLVMDNESSNIYLQINTPTVQVEDMKQSLINHAIGLKYSSLYTSEYDDGNHRLEISSSYF